MIIKEDVYLSNLTTIKIGGLARKLYYPESYDDLVDIVNDSNVCLDYVIGSGSNLLINDKRVFDDVISMKMVDTEIVHKGSGNFYVGCSVNINDLINEIQEQGYGGIEYLYTIPAYFGGIIAMNAGRGKKYKQSISDYVVNVIAIDILTGKKIIIDRENCKFSYRNSLLKEGNLVVLGAEMSFEIVDEHISKKEIQKKVERVRNLQDHSGYTFGSVFKKYNKYIMKTLQIFGFGHRGKAFYSRKTSNWIVNKGNCDFEDIYRLISLAKKIHRIFRFEIQEEVVIWK